MANGSGGLWGGLSRFDTSASVLERFWQILTVLSIGGGGLFTGFIAKADPVLKALGPIYWVAIGVLTSLVLAFVLLLIRAATLKNQMAAYYAALSAPKSVINPLSDFFLDQVISVEDLRLPGQQLHKNKIFKRCKFIGPGTLGLGGGNIDGVNLNSCGSVIALPESTVLFGVVYLKQCTIVDCEFFNITFLADKSTAQALRDGGVDVVGL
ncbi:hypothetical protein [Pseudomonas fulva]|uniref:hypothetical protein n=1 Tax=Pseudomonas fulva TaxID=47880 RepID=UPI0034CFECBA